MAKKKKEKKHHPRAGGQDIRESDDGEVSLRGIGKSYRRGSQTINAVGGIDLDIRRGEFLSLLGPEGAGKSTILRLIAGLEKPDTGVIMIGGSDATEDPPEKRRIPMVFQDLALFPHMTVYQNIAYGLRYQKLAAETEKATVESALNRVGLRHCARMHPQDLTPGEKQRLALARAIVPRPRIVLLDEPFFLLDTRMRRQLAFEIKRLQLSLGITMVYGTSSVGEALALSDRIAFLDGGRIVQTGTGEDLYRQPVSRIVADYIGYSNKIEAAAGKVRNKARIFSAPGKTLAIPEYCLRLRGFGALREGMETALYTKGENIVPAAAGRTGLPARVTGRFFHGPYSIIGLDVNGFELHMWQTSSSKLPEIGGKISVAFKKDSVIVFEASSGADDERNI